MLNPAGARIARAHRVLNPAGACTGFDAKCLTLPGRAPFRTPESALAPGFLSMPHPRPVLASESLSALPLAQPQPARARSPYASP